MTVRMCYDICKILEGAMLSARFKSKGKSYNYCAFCEVSLPDEVGYYITDSRGRKMCPCCKTVLRSARRNPFRREEREKKGMDYETKTYFKRIDPARYGVLYSHT